MIERYHQHNHECEKYQMVSFGNGSLRELIKLARGNITGYIGMSIGSQPLSDKRKTKELKVLKLYQEGYSSRKIASLVHLSLRDVTKYIYRISNKTKSPSTTSVMDEVVLEYRVAGLKCEVRDLKIERDNLMNKVKDLCTQKYNLLNQVRAEISHGHYTRSCEGECIRFPLVHL